MVQNTRPSSWSIAINAAVECVFWAPASATAVQDARSHFGPSGETGAQALLDDRFAQRRGRHETADGGDGLGAGRGPVGREIA